ncbi:MAG: glycosyl hydrolase family 28 protein [Candidatus Azobacteroides sp.]|nr:glycosyl hydrolase family 28 protein [Candidatus Azobacteroides sp.]
MRHILIIGITLWMSLHAAAQSFTVSCNGESVPLYEQNDVPASYKLSSYKYARLVYSGEPLNVSITADFSVVANDWDIAPYSYQIQGNLSDKTISFTIDRTGYVVVRFKKGQDFTRRVVLFIEEPEIMPDGDFVNLSSYCVDNTGQYNETKRIQKALDDAADAGKVVYFPDGTYKVSLLRIPSNSRVHLSKGCRLLADPEDFESFQNNDNTGTNRFIYIKDAENIQITGLGTFDGNGTYFRGVFDPNGSNGIGAMRVLFIVNSKNITFDGILLKDAARWNTQIVGCQDITFRNCKMLNNPNTNANLTNFDGWDPDASQRVLIENCFGWAGDDNVAVKCVGTGSPKVIQDVEDITIRGCVFLSKKSSLKIGTETRCNNMKNITFENNDVIEADRVIAIEVQDNAIVDGVLYKNNRSDYNYPDAQKRGIYFNLTERNAGQGYLGKILNVRIEDCTFNSVFPNKFRIYRDPAMTVIGDLQVTIKNLRVAGNIVNNLTTNYFDTANCNGVIVFE